MSRGKSKIKSYPFIQAPLDDVVDVINILQYNDIPKVSMSDERLTEELHPTIASQLQLYVTLIANHYHDNPFHNFEHACHVTMSLGKLLMGIQNPPKNHMESSNLSGQEDIKRRIHDFTYWINSNPLPILVITLSAIIHNIDHSGVSNMQLSQENPDMAGRYRHKSIAKQNSLDVAWNLLVSEQFNQLRDCLFTSQTEMDCFRQVVVNTVLATDIMDPELNEVRNLRWSKAFSPMNTIVSKEMKQNLCATIVIEHIIQASDVAHTMQHWQVYYRWNKLLFQEMHGVYCLG
jgi:3'5'-cyclic nucleotide phosphodiesterase